MAKRPTSARIGPFTYAIEWPIFVSDEDGEVVSGEAAHVELTIRVSRGLPIDLQRKTLLHELMHAAVFVTGHNTDEVTEEQFIRSSAFALFGILRDNPDVARFITSRTVR